jgi:hypothetical protein
MIVNVLLNPPKIKLPKNTIDRKEEKKDIKLRNYSVKWEEAINSTLKHDLRMAVNAGRATY